MPSPGLIDGKLADCPSSPNCVCSDASDAGHRIDAFLLAASPQAAWGAVRDVVVVMPRVQVVASTDTYLHAECRTWLMGFVDDLELHLRPDEGILAVRSASRTGYSDLGVNRRRIEDLRSALRARGVVK